MTKIRTPNSCISTVLKVLLVVKSNGCFSVATQVVEREDLTLRATQLQAQLVPTQMIGRKSQLPEEKDKSGTKSTIPLSNCITLCIHLYISYYIPDYIENQGEALTIALRPCHKTPY